MVRDQMATLYNLFFIELEHNGQLQYLLIPVSVNYLQVIYYSDVNLTVSKIFK